MSMEPRFRVWDAWENKMIFPNDGDLIGWHAPKNRKDSMIILQYTGLKDKNGVEICAGDIVKKERGVGYKSKYYPSFANGTQRESIVVVKYLHDHARFTRLTEGGDTNFDIEIEVLGNIYENPELLEKEK